MMARPGRRGERNDAQLAKERIQGFGDPHYTPWLYIIIVSLTILLHELTGQNQG